MKHDQWAAFRKTAVRIGHLDHDRASGVLSHGLLDRRERGDHPRDRTSREWLAFSSHESYEEFDSGPSGTRPREGDWDFGPSESGVALHFDA